VLLQNINRIIRICILTGITLCHVSLLFYFMVFFYLYYRIIALYFICWAGSEWFYGTIIILF